MVNDNTVTLTPHEIKKLKKFRNTLTESGYNRTIILFRDSNGKIIKDEKGEIFEHKINVDYIDNHTANQMFHLWPEPEELEDFNEYIVKAKKEYDLKYFYFFLHFFEPTLTDVARFEISRRGRFNYSPERLMNTKYDLVIYLLKKFLYFKPSFKTKFTTFIYAGLTNPVINSLSVEEAWTYNTLNEYKEIRAAGYKLNRKDKSFAAAVLEYMKEHKCGYQTAKKHLLAADEHRARCEYFKTVTETDDSGCEHKETTEDITVDEFWDEHNRLETVIPKHVMGDTLAILTEKERYIIKKHNAICMRCDRNKPLTSRYTFSEISERFEGSYKSESKQKK